MNGPSFAGMLRMGAATLAREKQAVNDLNVFPIPDGDTGDNMYMTIKTGCAALDGGASDSLSDTASAVSDSMLLGARGNSGVILSRIFAGLAKGLSGLGSASVADFSKAMEFAVREAYTAISNPVEGTIITVLREGAAGADREGDFGRYFETLLSAMRISLEHTPEQLKVLKDNGVVDSGGAGLVYIVEGMKEALEGAAAPEGESAPAAARTPSVDLSRFGEDSTLEFGYCTEFLLRLQTSKVDLGSFDEKPLIDWLCSHGESVVAFRDGSIFKVHVHTFHPGEVFNYMQQFGEFLTVKVENMTLQHHQTGNANNAAFHLPPKKYGIVTVASGEGLAETFRQIGADVVIYGGQTMNPSTRDFLDAFGKVNAAHILVFPNNPNIRMAAEQAGALYDGADVDVVPSEDFGQGYYGIGSVDRDSDDPDGMLALVREAMQGVKTGMVSAAVRDAGNSGITVHAGDFVGYSGKTILSCDTMREQAALGLCEALGASGRDVMLVFTGADVSEDEAAALSRKITAAYPNLEIIMNKGSQPIYDYIFVLC